VELWAVCVKLNVLSPFCENCVTRLRCIVWATGAFTANC
jgi:hypothetical protein